MARQQYRFSRKTIAMARAQRPSLEGALADMELLVALLDAVDGDPDMEDGADRELDGADDEPTLGWTDIEARRASYAARDGEAEPSLAAPEVHPHPGLWTRDSCSQLSWALGAVDDREFDDCDDEEENDREADDADNEPDDRDLPADLDFLDLPSYRRRSRPLPLLVHPDVFPDEYVMVVDGDCCEPRYFSGDKLKFDKARPKPGDFVAIFLAPSARRSGCHDVLVKRLVADLRGSDLRLPNGRSGIIVETLNPQRLFAVDADAILAIHRCMGRVGPGERTYALPQWRLPQPQGASA